MKLKEEKNPSSYEDWKKKKKPEEIHTSLPSII